MASATKLGSDIGTIFNAVWNIRDGNVVPETNAVALANGAVRLEAVFLYADLSTPRSFNEGSTTAWLPRLFGHTSRRCRNSSRVTGARFGASTATV
jgi:hypothetical protein